MLKKQQQQQCFISLKSPPSESKMIIMKPPVQFTFLGEASARSRGRPPNFLCARPRACQTPDHCRERYTTLQLMPWRRPSSAAGPPVGRLSSPGAGWRMRRSMWPSSGPWTAAWRSAAGGSPGSTAWMADITSRSCPTGRCSATGMTRTCTVRLQRTAHFFLTARAGQQHDAFTVLLTAGVSESRRNRL